MVFRTLADVPFYLVDLCGIRCGERWVVVFSDALAKPHLNYSDMSRSYQYDIVSNVLLNTILSSTVNIFDIDN